MKTPRTTFNQEIFILFIVIIVLACHQTKGVDVTLQRAVAGSGDDWSIGYQGEFYIATARTNIIDKIRWKVNDEVQEQIYDKIDRICTEVNSSRTTSFTSSCEPIPDGGVGIKSILHLNRELVSNDDGKDVKFSAEVSEAEHNKETTLNVKECSSSSINVESIKNKYNSSGKIICGNGYILYNTTKNETKGNITTTCQADGTWRGVDTVKCKPGIAVDLTLQRAIGNGDYWSIGYYGSLYKAVINPNVVEKLYWKFSNEIEEKLVDPFEGKCQVEFSNATSSNSTCYFNGGISSVLQLNRGLGIVDNGGFVELYAQVSKFENNTTNKVLNVKVCSASSPLHVSSDNAGYGSQGSFNCTNGGDLYNNGTKVENTSTICQADATWENADVYQCLKAPENVSITENFAIKEEDELSLTCEFDDSSADVPPVYSFRFYKNGAEIYCGETGNQNATCKLNVTRKDNRATFKCKAENIVNLDPNDLRGFSQPKVLNVYYKPNITDFTLLNPSKLIIDNNGTILMRSDQSLSMNCEVDSRPQANCTWIFQSDDIVSSRCNDTIKLETTGAGSLQCQATNQQYTDVAIRDVNVTLVDEKREPTIYNVSSSSMEEITTDKLDVNENSSLTLQCQVGYQKELSTTFNWMFSHEVVSNNKSLKLRNITTIDDGDYYCHTKDDFGDNNKSVSLNVLYPPRTDEHTTNQITCEWSINANEMCEIEFSSNPNADNCSVLKGETEFHGFSCLLINGLEKNVGDKKQKAVIQSVGNVTESDRGTYTLQIVSKEFPLSVFEMDFVVVIEEDDVAVKDDSLIIIICCCVGGFLIILLLLGFVIYKRKQKPSVEKTISETVAEDFGLTPTTATDFENSSNSAFSRHRITKLLKTFKTSVHTRNKSAASNEAFVDDKDVKAEENEYIESPIDQNKKNDNSTDEGNNEEIPEIIYSEVDKDGIPTTLGVGKETERIPEVIYSELDGEGNSISPNDKGESFQDDDGNTILSDTNQPTSKTYMDIYSVVSKNKSKEEEVSPTDGDIYSVVIKKKPQAPKIPVKTEEESPPTDANAYSVIDKNKKKPKPPKKPVKIDEEPTSSTEVYCVVDKTKKKPKPPTKPVKKEEENPATDGNAYSVIDKSKKKPKPPKKPVKINEEPPSSADVYSVIDKTKKKPVQKEQENSLYGDVYNSVVDKSNKKQEHQDEIA